MVKNEGIVLLEVFTQMFEEVAFSGLLKRNLIPPPRHESVSSRRVRTPSQSLVYFFSPKKSMEDYSEQHSSQ